VRLCAAGSDVKRRKKNQADINGREESTTPENRDRPDEGKAKKQDHANAIFCH